MVESWNPRKIIHRTVSQYDQYCEGVFSGEYIAAVTLHAATVRRRFTHAGSMILDRINAFDVAEADGPYIGQINMISATSFCGHMGLLWGYDVARVKGLEEKENEVRDVVVKGRDGEDVKVYRVEPLVEAAKALFGTREDRHFPLAPGGMVLCATKDETYPEKGKPQKGIKSIYCAVGIGIPKREKRGSHAVLWMEDHGELPSGSNPEHVIRSSLAKSIVRVGHNQCVTYEKVFVGLKSTKVRKPQFGCALVAIPYLRLARFAIPDGGGIQLVYHDDTNKPGRMGLREWEKAVRKHFLSAKEKALCPKMDNNVY